MQNTLMHTLIDSWEITGIVRWSLLTVVFGIKYTFVYLFLFAVYHYLDLHARFGFFKRREPLAHFWTALKNWKYPFLWAVGVALFCAILGLTAIENGRLELKFALPEEWIFLHSPSLLTDLIYAVIGFYVMDFVNYWAHRLNHVGFLFTRFPFAHFVHHNCVLPNPTVTYSSPLIHLSGWSGLVVYTVMLSQGLWLSVLIMHLVRTFSAWNSHLGFDPLPWLTRLNHRVGGWIPWIPLHHQYHHLPFIRGNYGNVTSLWDYVFGTINPECVVHLTTGAPSELVVEQLEAWENNADEYYRHRTGLSLPPAAVRVADIETQRASSQP